VIPLRIQVLFHWESEEARRLAGHLYRTFSARPTGGGPRIPVRYGQCDGSPPKAPELSAEHEIYVVLVDERMARRTRASDRPVADAWGRLATELVKAHGPGTTSPHRVLPVALDVAALQLTPDLDNISFVRLDVRGGSARDSHLTLHVACRALRALRNISPPTDEETDHLPQIPVRLFISHAKADLSRDPAALADGPVRAIHAKLAEVPIENWIDAKQIPPGGRFDEEIERGVLNSTALIAVLTDNWPPASGAGERYWRRR
jgi:hypothetical protein